MTEPELSVAAQRPLRQPAADVWSPPPVHKPAWSWSSNRPPAGVPTWYVPASTEYVFIYDISTPAPVKKQVLTVPNTYNGIVFDPTGAAFYVSGGPSDNIHVVTLSADGSWADQPAMTLALGHRAGLGLGVLPCAAGVAISKDGQTLVVVNYYNDSITIFRGGLGNWSRWRELDLRPGIS